MVKHGASTLLAVVGGLTLGLSSEPAKPPELLVQTAGTYRRGNGLSFNLTLVLDHEQYTLRTYSDYPPDGTREERGRIAVEGDGIALLPPAPGSRRSLLVVPWGPRLYLVEKDELADFCRDAAAGGEPRKDSRGKWFLREADWSSAVSAGSMPVSCMKTP